MQLRSAATASRVWLPLAALLVLLAFAFPASSSAAFYANEDTMSCTTNPFNRYTFMVDPGVCQRIPRDAFSGPLAGFYESHGFDANFLDWAPTAELDPAGLKWSSCVDAPHAGPCSDIEPDFHVVSNAIGSGPITTLTWNGAFISFVCGNFSEGGGTGPAPQISGVKYEDMNGNGQRDADEPGLSGWTIELRYGGNVVAQTTTGADGSYSFTLNADQPPIGPGRYEVDEVQQQGWVASQAPGPIDVPLGAGDTNYGGNDFGNYRPAVVSGHKFDDANVDGQRADTELGLPNWTIQLSDGETALTAADGSYSFSVPPGQYSVQELLKDGWRQTSPGGDGTRTFTLRSGDVVDTADFGNVCLGGVQVGPIDDSTGNPISGMEVRIEEVSVPGILANDPPLPRTTTGTPTFGSLLPGTYRIVAFLPDGVFTTDPDAVVVDGRFAIVKQVTVKECDTTQLPLHLFTRSTPGKVTGGSIVIGLPGGGTGTSGFVFMTKPDGPSGSLEYQDHGAKLDLHTSTIEAIDISGDVAFVWGRVPFGDTTQRFRLRLVDAGEPGTSDRYELTVANGYAAGQGETLQGGNIQIHRTP